MELNEQLQVEIADIFRSVEWGKITFRISPESKTLDYTKETTGKLPIKDKIIPRKKRLTVRTSKGKVTLDN